MLDLVGGAGTAPEAPEPPVFVIDPTPEDLRAMDDEALFDVYDAVMEYDASGGRVRRKVRREIDRRRKETP